MGRDKKRCRETKLGKERQNRMEEKESLGHERK